jgi:hypothetical protein
MVGCQVWFGLGDATARRCGTVTTALQRLVAVPLSLDLRFWSVVIIEQTFQWSPERCQHDECCAGGSFPRACVQNQQTAKTIGAGANLCEQQLDHASSKVLHL